MNFRTEVITLSVSLLTGATIFTILVAVFFLSESSKRIQLLADRMEITIHHIEEPYREAEGIRYKGTVFKEIKQVVSEASNELLVLGTTVVGEELVDAFNEHPGRADYLKTLEKVVESNLQKGFKYVRINQIPPKIKDLSMIKYLGSTTANHCRRILELERNSNIPSYKSSITIMKVPTSTMSHLKVVRGKKPLACHFEEQSDEKSLKPMLTRRLFRDFSSQARRNDMVC